jgi:hypothetical protein
MLRACLDVRAVSENVSQLRTESIKVRVSLDSTHEQIETQIKDAFGLDANSLYELTNDGELCSLRAVVSSLVRWVQERDALAPLEFEGVIEGNKATLPMIMKVSNLSRPTPPKSTTRDTPESVKRQRTHTEWKQDALEVRCCMMHRRSSTSICALLTTRHVQFTRELHPRTEKGLYVLITEVTKSDLSEENRALQEKTKDLYDKLIDLIVHKTMVQHQVPKKEVLTHIRRYALYEMHAIPSTHK